MMFSPGWPKRYPPRTDCVWALYSSTPGKQVAVEFTMIDIEACCDHLTVSIYGRTYYAVKNFAYMLLKLNRTSA